MCAIMKVIISFSIWGFLSSTTSASTASAGTVPTTETVYSALFWVGGSTASGAAATSNFGLMGVSSVSNQPRPRGNAGFVFDGTAGAWLLGGVGSVAAGNGMFV